MPRLLGDKATIAAFLALSGCSSAEFDVSGIVADTDPQVDSVVTETASEVPARD